MNAELSLWDKLVRYFKNSPIGVAILAVLVVFGAARELRDVPSLVRRSDLSISALTDSERVAPLAGHPILKPESGPYQRIYAGGARITILLQHNRYGDTPVSLTGMRLNLVEYDPGERSEYRYEVDADSIIGAGIVRPFVYSVRLLGSRVARAVWLPHPDSAPLTAKSENFLDTDDPFIAPLGPKDPPQPLLVNVVAEHPGLYVITFTIEYDVANKARHESPTGNVVIYRQ